MESVRRFGEARIPSATRDQHYAQKDLFRSNRRAPPASSEKQSPTSSAATSPPLCSLHRLYCRLKQQTPLAYAASQSKHDISGRLLHETEVRIPTALKEVPHLAEGDSSRHSCYRFTPSSIIQALFFLGHSSRPSCYRDNVLGVNSERKLLHCFNRQTSYNSHPQRDSFTGYFVLLHDGKAPHSDPVVISPDGLFPSLFREDWPSQVLSRWFVPFKVDWRHG